MSLDVGAGVGKMSGQGTTQFLNQKLLEEKPMFSKTKVDFTPRHPLTHQVVSDNRLVLTMANRSIIRICGDMGHKEELDLSKLLPGAKISSLFLDPSGHHLLLSLKLQ